MGVVVFEDVGLCKVSGVELFSGVTMSSQRSLAVLEVHLDEI